MVNRTELCTQKSVRWVDLILSVLTTTMIIAKRDGAARDCRDGEMRSSCLMGIGLKFPK